MITGVLLAAGAGRRAGGPKALRHDHDGTGWLRRSAEALLAGGCTRVVVVLGAAAPDAVELVVDVPGVSIVVAPDWQDGMGASLRRGLQTVLDDPAAGDADDHPGLVCVHLVDLPDVTAPVISRVLAHDRGPATLARAAYDGRPGHPVLIGRDHLGPLAATLHGDEGGRRYLSSSEVTVVECGDVATGRDVDAGPVTLGGRTPGA